jgi:sirohydrochlorin ferrochelatase
MKRSGIQGTVLVMGHGSRDADGVSEFVALVDAVRAAAGGVPVEAGFLEFPGLQVGSIQDAVDRCARSGRAPVLTVPLLLFCAGHGQADMPAQVLEARTRHPELDLRAKPILGTDPTLLEIVEQRLCEAQQGLPDIDPEQVAVLLVGRGATDAEANAEFFKIGRLLWERNHYGWVECAFVSLAWPDVPAGVDRCVRMGARRVVVVPYFLNTGVLVKRISERTRLAQLRYQGVEIALAAHMGPHPKLVRLVLDRAADAQHEGPSHPLHAAKLWRYQEGL